MAEGPPRHESVCQRHATRLGCGMSSVLRYWRSRALHHAFTASRCQRPVYY